MAALGQRTAFSLPGGDVSTERPAKPWEVPGGRGQVTSDKGHADFSDGGEGGESRKGVRGMSPGQGLGEPTRGLCSVLEAP